MAAADIAKRRQVQGASSPLQSSVAGVGGAGGDDGEDDLKKQHDDEAVINTRHSHRERHRHNQQREKCDAERKRRAAALVNAQLLWFSTQKNTATLLLPHRL